MAINIKKSFKIFIYLKNISVLQGMILLEPNNHFIQGVTISLEKMPRIFSNNPAVLEPLLRA